MTKTFACPGRYDVIGEIGEEFVSKCAMAGMFHAYSSELDKAKLKAALGEFHASPAEAMRRAVMAGKITEIGESTSVIVLAVSVLWATLAISREAGKDIKEMALSEGVVVFGEPENKDNVERVEIAKTLFNLLLTTGGSDFLEDVEVLRNFLGITFKDIGGRDVGSAIGGVLQTIIDLMSILALTCAECVKHSENCNDMLPGLAFLASPALREEYGNG